MHGRHIPKVTDYETYLFIRVNIMLITIQKAVETPWHQGTWVIVASLASRYLSKVDIDRTQFSMNRS